MSKRRLPAFGLLVLAPVLQAASSEYPLAINLPTADRMQFWDLGVAFQHRFIAPARNNGKNLFGLDGYAYAGFGFAAGIKPVKGLNLMAYRTADNKTVVLGLQEALAETSWMKLALRLERFDEAVERAVVPAPPDAPQGEIGISGATAQVVMEFYLGDDLVLNLVPTWLSRTTTVDKGVVTCALGVRYTFTEAFGMVAELYPVPSKVKTMGREGGPLVQAGRTYTTGFAVGATYKTFKHRFSLFGTNTSGTSTHQVLGGDYAGGPRAAGNWSLGFNVTRVF